MKSTIRHDMNLGAAAERKAMRGIITKLARNGTIDWGAATQLRAAIREHIKAISKAEGGIGRK